MNKKLVALISKTQLKNLKAAGFKLIDVYDTGDYTLSATETAKHAKWQFTANVGTDNEVNIEIEFNVKAPTNRALIYQRIHEAGIDEATTFYSP
jgi:hypothetical protein